MKLNVFAERIGMSYRNLYKVFEKESINTELLERISSVLKHDFFSHYYKNKTNTLSEPKAEYKKQDNKGVEISFNLKFNDPGKQAELLKLLFGNNIPESLKDSF
jgi:hypothetical protein